MIFTFIDRACSDLPVAVCCRVMKVSTSGFYAWLAQPCSDRDHADAVLTSTIVDIHRMSRRSYGSPRVHAELRLGLGTFCSRKRVERLMRQAGVAGIHRRRRAGCTRRDLDAQPSDDLVARQFDPVEADRLWVMDVTEHPTSEGKVYLAVVLDVQPTGRGLVDRRPRPLRARRRRRADGHLATPATRGTSRCTLGPRVDLHVMGVRPTSPRRRPTRLYGQHR
jgi:hypothetical protein